MLHEKTRDVNELEGKITQLISEINSLYIMDEENKKLQKMFKDMEEDKIQVEIESEEKIK